MIIQSDLNNPGRFGLVLVDDGSLERKPLSLGFSASKAPPVDGVRMWRPGAIVDQGSTSSCVGCGWGSFFNADPLRSKYDFQYMYNFYIACQKVDGLSELVEPRRQGSTIQGGAMIAQERGLIQDALFTNDPEELISYVYNRGPMVIGTNWYEGMESPDANGFVKPTGRNIGGHCTCVIGINGVLKEVVIQNSWGEDYANHGICIMTFDDFRWLFRHLGSIGCSPMQIKL